MPSAEGAEQLSCDWNLHTLLVGMQNDTSTLENHMAAFFFLIMLNTLFPSIDLANPLLHIHSWEIKTYAHTRLDIYNNSIHSSHKLEKQPQCPSTGEWKHNGHMSIFYKINKKKSHIKGFSTGIWLWWLYHYSIILPLRFNSFIYLMYIEFLLCTTGLKPTWLGRKLKMWWCIVLDILHEVHALTVSDLSLLKCETRRRDMREEKV